MSEYEREWLVKSQPIAQYLRADNYECFTQFLYEKWRENPIKVQGHQCAFIYKKRV